MQIMHLLKAFFLAVMLMTAVGSNADVPRPELTIASEGKCVEPVDIMRKDHMEFILHQRDETMYGGIRTSKHSLKQCISCHAVKDESGEYVRSDDPKHFCSTCHEYASVSIDCFDCHSDTPRETDIHELRVNE